MSARALGEAEYLKDLSVLQHTLVVEDYAMLLPTDSPQREAINRAVLHIVSSASWKAALQHSSGTLRRLSMLVCDASAREKQQCLQFMHDVRAGDCTHATVGLVIRFTYPKPLSHTRFICVR